MGLRDVIARVALGAPVPVFAVSGAGAREEVAGLRLSPRIELVDTPAAASILLVAGFVPSKLSAALAAVHDAMPEPRCTVHWPLGADQGQLPTAPHAVLVGPDQQAVEVLTHALRALLTGTRPSEPAIQPDLDPNPWRGLGPYGQGGSGMTGGTPYGRPLAELAPDRDGLRLDLLPLRIGPFFPRFAAGLTLEVTMAGDIVVEAGAADSPFVAETPTFTARPGLQPFLRALSEPVPLAELELARAREHLHWASAALISQGLPALAARVLRLAMRLTPGDASAVDSLAGRLRHLRVPQWSSSGVGPIGRELLVGLGAGPVARAAGLADDARADDPSYVTIGFEPIVTHGSDAGTRWQLRLAEAAQSLNLAVRAGERRIRPVGRIESPRGRLEVGSAPFDRLRPLLPAILSELEWGDAVTTLVSLDLDPEEAGAVSSSTLRMEAA